MKPSKLRIVCVHGYKGKAENLTYRKVKKLFPKDELIAETYDLADSESVLMRIGELKPDILIGNSLGGFYVMACCLNCKKIVINPCLVPSVEIPKLDETVPSDAVRKWKDIEKRVMITGYENVFGIFASDDELFRFKKVFDVLCGDEEHSILVKGTHILKDPGLSDGIKHALTRLGISY